MIQFPETVQAELKTIFDEVNAAKELKVRIERGTLVEREVEKLRVRHSANQLHQQEIDADQTPALEMGTLSTFNSSPAAAPPDLIDGVLKQNGLCILLGESGSGKSTLALQMLNSLMTGEDWLGQPTKPIMGSVGLISYDQDVAISLDWMSGFPNIDWGKVRFVNAYKRGNPLNVPAMREQIVQTWKAANTEVVVIDSFSASFFGLDQNDAGATQHHYRDLIAFALNEVGAKALIVIVHSTGGSPHKARGSSVHHDVADSIVSVEGTGSKPRKLKMVKYRALRGQYQMDPVIITAPDDVTHLVDLDLSEMALAGMPLPATAQAAAFTAVPEPTEAPDTDSETDEDDDL